LCEMIMSPAIVIAALLAQGLPPPRRVIEAERLIDGAQMTHGTVIQQEMVEYGPDWGGGAQLYWAIHEVGARIVMHPEVTRAGRYDVYVHFTQAPDYARVSVRFDAGPVKTFDGWATTVRPFRFRLATVELAAGRHDLTITVVGKNKVSDDYYVGVDRIEFVPVHARPPRSL
jgi:hypothetical protein